MDEVWVRSPAWVLQCVAGTAGEPAQLLVSGGADETYWVDELASSDGAQRVFEAWQANALHALRDDAACGAAVRQLRRLGAVLPQAAVQAVHRFALCWWGDEDGAWLQELDRQLADAQSATPGQPRLQRVGGEAAQQADVLQVYARSTASWVDALRPYCAEQDPRPQLLIDLAYHHTLVLGPWVVPGQTACLACMGLRTVRRWGDAAVPAQPQALAQAGLSVALLLQVLRAAADVGGQAAWVEHSVQFDLRSLQTQRVRVYRQPWCPACSGQLAQDGGAEAAQGRIALA